MGFLDALRKLGDQRVAPADPQCAIGRLLTVRLPGGWQFTDARSDLNGDYFVASGPGGSSATFSCSFLQRGSENDPEYLRGDGVAANLDLVHGFARGYLLKGKVSEDKTQDGIVWLEGNDLDGRTKQMYFALMNSKPPAPLVFAPLLRVNCCLPAKPAAGGPSGERFDTIRTALRNVEWGDGVERPRPQAAERRPG